MPTVTLRPVANGSRIELLPYGASENWDCVDEEVADGDATYVYTDQETLKTDSYQLSDSGLSSNVVINSVTIYHVSKQIGRGYASSRVYFFLHTNGQPYSGDRYTPTSTYQTYSQTFTTNPITGESWTVEEIDALEAGAQMRGMWIDFRNYAYPYLTQLYVVVDYSLPSVTHKHARRGADILIRPHAIVLIKRNGNIVGYRKPHPPFSPERPIQPEVAL